LRESIRYGYTHQDEAIPYSLKWGRGIDSRLGEKFVKMYVSDLTVDMGEKGKQALTELFRLGSEKDLLPPMPEWALY
ncbi:MAG: ABC transporter substrate-binding protein, partial [Syntrophobacteraceae bacterium CG23_combo_of_CG06-09_8_20_14_all_50_8]